MDIKSTWTRFERWLDNIPHRLGRAFKEIEDAGKDLFGVPEKKPNYFVIDQDTINMLASLPPEDRARVLQEMQKSEDWRRVAESVLLLDILSKTPPF